MASICGGVRLCEIEVMTAVVSSFAALTGQAGNCGLTLGVGTMAGRTCRNIGLREALLEDFLPRSDKVPRAASNRRRIETLEMRGHGRSHLRAEAMHPGHVYEDISVPTALGKTSQLILYVLGLLVGESRHGEIPTITLARQAMAVLAIFDLGSTAAAPRGAVDLLPVAA